MRNAKVYTIETGPELTRPREGDGFVCNHCNKTVFVKPFEDASNTQGFCTDCMKFICQECVNKRECTPFLKKIEREEAKAAAYRGWF